MKVKLELKNMQNVSKFHVENQNEIMPVCFFAYLLNGFPATILMIVNNSRLFSLCLFQIHEKHNQNINAKKTFKKLYVNVENAILVEF